MSFASESAIKQILQLAVEKGIPRECIWFQSNGHVMVSNLPDLTKLSGFMQEVNTILIHDGDIIAKAMETQIPSK